MCRNPEAASPWTEGDVCVHIGNVVYAVNQQAFDNAWNWLETHGYTFVKCENVSFIGLVCWAECAGSHSQQINLPSKIGLNMAWRWTPLRPEPKLFGWLLRFVGGVTDASALSADAINQIKLFVQSYTTLNEPEDWRRALVQLDELCAA